MVNKDNLLLLLYSINKFCVQPKHLTYKQFFSLNSITLIMCLMTCHSFYFLCLWEVDKELKFSETMLSVMVEKGAYPYGVRGQ